MYSLRLLGGMHLEGPAGAVGAVATRRRPLALLAALAVAGRDGLTRHQAAALLWGDIDDKHALRSLSEALYALRVELGPDAIRSTATGLAINDAVIEADVATFLGALRRGDRVAAVAAYSGPFLDGVHIPEAQAFAEWVDGVRGRLAGQFTAALERLATDAGVAGDHVAAVTWWRRLADEDRLNSRLAMELARALARTGDRGNALQQLQAHVRELRAELGAAPDAAVLTLLDELRTGSAELAPPPVPPVQAAAVTPAGRDAAVSESAAGPVHPVAMAPPRPAREARWWRRPAAVVAAAAVLVVAGAVAVGRWPHVGAPGPRLPRTAIAVLPFENLSAEAPLAFLAPALHEELLTQLAKVAALSVRARTSVMQYAGTTKTAKVIAAELAVGTIVEGSVQVAGDRLRVNVQLIDAATDRHLWAEHFDRTLDDAFAVQSEIAQRIVAAVGATLTGAEAGAIAAAPSANAEAYLLYLQGREYWLRPGQMRENLESAQQLYERAVALDPGFALAHAGLSLVHSFIYWFAYDPSPARWRRGRDEAETALRLAPGLPQAHLAMGRTYATSRNWRAALAEYRLALQALPSDGQLWAYVGYAQRRLGHWSEVLASFAKATQLNPRDADLYRDLGGVTYEVLHRYAESVRADERALSLAPDYHGAAVSRGWTYVRWQGRFDTLRAALRGLPTSAALGFYGTGGAQWALLFLLERQPDGLLRVVMSAPAGVFDEQEAYWPGALYAAWAHQLRGDRPAARAAFDSARVLLDSVMRKLPDDWRVHVARGMALAGLGRRAEALREARWLHESAIYRDDASEGPIAAEDYARILAQAGDVDAALAEIQRLLAGPSWLSVHTLRLDPRWDPIRHDPRFQALLKRYGG